MATIDGNRIVVKTAQDGNFEQTLAACKAVAGGRWRKADKVWAYPLAVETCHDLRLAFGERLAIGLDLAAWYRQAAEQRAVHADLSAATDAPLPRLAATHPGLYNRLRGDQRAGAAWAAALYRGAGLLADEPGCGKTWIVIASILEADVKGPIMVACPRLAVKSVWHHTLRDLAPDERVYVCRGTRAKRQRAIDRFRADPAERKWLILVGETLRVKATKGTANRYVVEGYEYPDLFEIPWAQVIFDESHKAFGSLTVVKGNLMGLGMKAIGKMAPRRLAMTGTPFGKGGRLTGMFGTLHWLWPDEFTSYWRWAERYFEIDEEEVYIKGGGGRKRNVKRVGDLKKGTEEEFLKSFGPRIMRRLLTEVLPWLPKERYAEVICEMEGAQLKQYQGLLDDAEIVVPGGVIAANGVLAEITRAKQLANGALYRDEDGKVRFDPKASCKIDNLLERLEARGILDGAGHMKVIVGSQYNEFLDAIGERLTAEGVKYLQMDGRTSDSKRDKLMEQFQAEGGPRVFLINIKAGGVSVTLDAADEAHAMDEMWDPGDMFQWERRIQRASRAPTAADAGKRPPVLIVYYRTEGTLDTNIGAGVEERRKNQHAVLDGRRGIDYVREVIRYRKPKED